jgi:hypothetical protein
MNQKKDENELLPRAMASKVCLGGEKRGGRAKARRRDVWPVKKISVACQPSKIIGR